MRVLNSTAASRPNMGGSQGKSEKAELFSQILHGKRKDLSPEGDPASPASPLAAAGERGTTCENTTKEPGAIAGPPAWPKVTELANEIVDRAALGGTHDAPSIHIEFKSRTLHGLQVQVQSIDGLVSVNFSTAVPPVAELLSNHLDSLRLALQSRGVRIRQLSISSRAAGATAKNARWTR